MVRNIIVWGTRYKGTGYSIQPSTRLTRPQMLASECAVPGPALPMLMLLLMLTPSYLPILSPPSDCGIFDTLISIKLDDPERERDAATVIVRLHLPQSAARLPVLVFGPGYTALAQAYPWVMQSDKWVTAYVLWHRPFHVEVRSYSIQPHPDPPHPSPIPSSAVALRPTVVYTIQRGGELSQPNLPSVRVCVLSRVVVLGSSPHLCGRRCDEWDVYLVRPVS